MILAATHETCYSDIKDQLLYKMYKIINLLPHTNTRVRLNICGCGRDETGGG